MVAEFSLDDEETELADFGAQLLTDMLEGFGSGTLCNHVYEAELCLIVLAQGNTVDELYLDMLLLSEGLVAEERAKVQSVARSSGASGSPSVE